MAARKDFTPWDFVKLVKELSEHEAGLKIKLAQAGVGTGSQASAAEGQSNRT